MASSPLRSPSLILSSVSCILLDILLVDILWVLPVKFHRTQELTGFFMVKTAIHLYVAWEKWSERFVGGCNPINNRALDTFRVVWSCAWCSFLYLFIAVNKAWTNSKEADIPILLSQQHHPVHHPRCDPLNLEPVVEVRWKYEIGVFGWR